MHKNCVFCPNIATFFAGQPLLPTYIFLATMFGGCGPLKFLMVENMPRIMAKLPIVN